MSAEELGRPLAMALGGIGALGGVSLWVFQKVKPILGQNWRDTELAADYKKLLDQHRDLKKDHDQIIRHALKLEANVQLLSEYVARLASTVAHMSALFPAIMKGKEGEGPFLMLVEQMRRDAEEMRQKADETAALAVEDAVALENCTNG